ncbi:MAG: type II toxin-antitoxin system HipA family toxin [Trueperaceae bacterium]
MKRDAAAVEVFLSLEERDVRVGRLTREPRRGFEAVGFSYAEAWLAHPDRYALEPGLALVPGTYAPQAGRAVFGAIGDSAPDTWGRTLLRRAERLAARREGRPVRTLQELDFLLGVADVARVGALRFRWEGGERFEAPAPDGVPSVVHVRRLLDASDRTLRMAESEEDLRLLLAPGSSLGGARPKASVVESGGALSIAKFPKETDEYPLERWEAVALRLAERSGIAAASARVLEVDGRIALIVRRFDRAGERRVPYLSAMAMLGRADGELASYLEIADAIGRHGARSDADRRELYRRLAFNVLVSNVDDHLRNHGFLWGGREGWRLSPAFDLNPTPVDVRERRLTTAIDLEDGTCDLALVLEVAPFFGLGDREARSSIRGVADGVGAWRSVARDLGAGRAEIDRMASAFDHDDARAAARL